MVENDFNTYVVKQGKVFYSKEDRIKYFTTRFLGHLKNARIVIPKTIKDNLSVNGNTIKYSKNLLTKLEALKDNASGDNKKAISNFKTSLENVIDVSKENHGRILTAIE